MQKYWLKEYHGKALPQLKVEMSCLHRLKHLDWFPEVYQKGEDYLLMDYAGKSLNLEGAEFPVDVVCIDLKSIVCSLEGCDIRHRDITPENVCWNEVERRTMLIDFGWSTIDCREQTVEPAFKSWMGLSDEEQVKILTEYLKHKQGGGNAGWTSFSQEKVKQLERLRVEE